MPFQCQSSQKTALRWLTKFISVLREYNFRSEKNKWDDTQSDVFKFFSSDYTIPRQGLSTIMKAINGYLWEPVGTDEVLEDSIKVSDTVSHDMLMSKFS